MPQRTQFGLTLIMAGLGLVAIGALVYLGALSWLDVERPGTRFYAPITSMILLSLALSAIAALIRRLLR